MKRPRPKYQVFVSSTYKDLSAERERVIWGILNARHIPAGMENFTATTDRGWETIRRVIDLTDYYVVILAGLYGTVDESTGKSWTQREYEYAVENRIPVLGFIRNDASITQDRVEKDVELRNKLEAFKDVLKSKHLVLWWSDAEDLARKVVDSLRNHISDDEETDCPRPGWYRGDALGFSPNVADELARLSAENNALRRQVEDLNASSGVVFELLDVKGTPLATYEESRARLVFEADTPERMDFGIRAVSVFGREPTPDDYESFLEGTNRSLEIEARIKNAGNKPAKSVVVDFFFDNCEDVSLLSLGVPQNQGYALSAPRIVPKWKTDPNEHVYVDSYSAKDDEGSIRQRVKLIAPGVNENLVSFWIRAKDAEQSGWSSVCTYSITDSEGATVKGTFPIKVSFDKRKTLTKKQFEKEFK